MSSDLKSRLAPITRRSSAASSKSSTVFSTWKPSSAFLSFGGTEQALQVSPNLAADQRPGPRPTRQETPDTSWESALETPLDRENPRVIIEKPTPERGRSSASTAVESPPQTIEYTGRPDLRLKKTLRPTIAARRRSPIPDGHIRLFSALHRFDQPSSRPSFSDYLSDSSARIKMPHRKVWVKRPGSSATQVAISEDDLVDDVRDMILKKYANSLGRNFDPPDVTLRLVQRKYSARHSNHERPLGPEEVVCKLLDMYYPGAQTIEEALLIDVPQRRTPKHSPRIAMPYYMPDGLRPGENQTDYFPIMPAGPTSPQIPSNYSVASSQAGMHRQNSHAIAILETGQLPDLPSPGSRMTRHSHRPKYGRQHTTSPTMLASNANNQNIDIIKGQHPQPLPTPPLPTDLASQRVGTPPPRTSSPRPSKPAKRQRKPPSENQPSTSSTSNNLLDNSIPPINVLVVEDNIINLKLLEAFLKRLKVRWSTAMNGRDAVARWREGGYHLVLMDIQLPIMNGLEATKEIRRLEKVHDIGVFTSSASSTPTFAREDIAADGANETKTESKSKAEDSLMNRALFKSPVIIVALTASSLQSDRHEALAAGCNDFLTKPVNFDWLSRKVTEWGCMQALIDFDGWRKWKDFSNLKTTTTKTSQPQKEQNKIKPAIAAIKTKASPQPTTLGGSKDTISPRSIVAAASMNGQLSSTGGFGGGGLPKVKRAPTMLPPSLDGIGEEGRERSTSDETDNTTDSNAEDNPAGESSGGGVGKAVAVGA